MGADHSILSPRSESANPTNEGSGNLPQVTIYVDGACVPNPGTAGIGAVLICGSHRRELSEPIGRASNNGAEIMAAVTALRALTKPCNVTVYSDSQYVVRTMNREFQRGSNQALWILLDQAASIHTVEWKWVRGHNGDLNNERANTLAEQAVRLNETEGLFS